MANKKVKKETKRNFWGEKVTTTFVDGRKVGSTKYGQGFFGNKNIHFKPTGGAVGYTKDGQGFFGNISTRHRMSGEKVGYTKHRQDRLGRSHAEHFTSGDMPAGPKERREWFGDRTTPSNSDASSTSDYSDTSTKRDERVGGHPTTIHHGDIPGFFNKPDVKPGLTARSDSSNDTGSSSVSSGSASSQKKPKPRGATGEYFPPCQALSTRSEKKPTPTPSSSDGSGGREIGSFVGDSIGSALGLLGIGFLFYCIFESISKPKLEKSAEKKNEEPEPQPFLNFRQVGGDKETLDQLRRLEEEMPDLRRSLEEGIARSKIHLAQLKQRCEQERLAKAKEDEENFCNRPIEVLQAELKQAHTSKQRLRLINAIAKKPRSEKTSSLLPSAPKMFPRPRPTYMCPERKDRPRPYVPRIYERKTPGKILELAVMTVGVIAAILVLAIKMGFISIGE